MDLFGNTAGAPTVGILFLHGFQGNRTHLLHHAEAIASEFPEKAVCACVDLPSLTKGGTFRELFVDKSVRSAQVNAVAFVVEKCQTLRDRFGGTSLKRVILVGHSAGGAIAVEAAVALQGEKRKEEKTEEKSAGGGRALDVAGLILLDAVPWEGTFPVATQLKVGSGSTIRVLSVRCDPSSWNGHGNVRPMTDAWATATAATTMNNDMPSSDEEKRHGSNGEWSCGRVLSVRVRGSRHFDPIERDSHILRFLGQKGSKVAREGVTRLVRAYALDLVRSEGSSSEETNRVLETSASLFDVDGK
uniref:AB hydrolase-1 domain-containing protein n=1 Tax=Odontella aurita TaxID=265563 RepID=A0A7S4HZA4_9STRA|mmetsp:Transcript_1755/g.4671  ORF Transcript_1755/g.4671 Transcript_1755/m.4671 type:complete len:302 (+) Transcript_1755:53-958(+)